MEFRSFGRLTVYRFWCESSEVEDRICAGRNGELSHHVTR